MTEHARPYSSLASVYDRWMGETVDYGGLAARSMWLLGGVSHPRVLDICVGTGSLALLLAEAGATVVGIDSSPEMLEVASARLMGTRPRCQLHRLDVAHDPWPEGPWDLITVTGDSLNYLNPEQLAVVVGRAGAALAPSGRVLFDLNTPHKLIDLFADTTYAQSFEDFAYIWENRLDPSHRHIDFLITLFRLDGLGQWCRAIELHRQYIHTFERIVELANGAHLKLGPVTDSYTDDQPAAPDATRWVIEARKD